MPPKAPPPPEEPEVEEEKPALSPEEALAKAMGMTAKPQDPQLEGLMSRSAGIRFDPKMKEIQGLLGSHTEATSAVSLSSGAASSSGPSRKGRAESLRTGGCGLVDRRMKELEQSAPRSLVDDRRGLKELESSFTSPPSTPSGVAGEVWKRIAAEEEIAIKEAARARMDRLDSGFPKCRYRDTTDKTLKRLLIDMDLARDPDRQKHYSHQTRCDHLDKMHTWYAHHTLKEDKKERKAPPYLRFSQEGPVSPGSMRVQFKQTSPLLTMSKSGSSPALLG